MGLSFLAPVFLAGVLAVAIPIVLHLFRRRTDRVVDFPAMQMLPEAPVESDERRRLRDLLLLALRAAALVLLAVSFARPYFASGAAQLLAGAGDHRRGRPLAQSRGPGAVGRGGAPGVSGDRRRHRPTHLVGVVAFDDRADLVVAPTVDRACGACRGGRAARPASGGTRYASALARAAEALAQRRRPHRAW